ncbi:hypothetical protein BJY00DRAFT_250789 [Aspergillus carlsbadensis]|nr:hypothetical protein BJY00DRAFT_250789 [Aspergillus carlsbadensis]
MTSFEQNAPDDIQQDGRFPGGDASVIPLGSDTSPGVFDSNQLSEVAVPIPQALGNRNEMAVEDSIPGSAENLTTEDQTEPDYSNAKSFTPDDDDAMERLMDALGDFMINYQLMQRFTNRFLEVDRVMLDHILPQILMQTAENESQPIYTPKVKSELHTAFWNGHAVRSRSCRTCPGRGGLAGCTASFGL